MCSLLLLFLMILVNGVVVVGGGGGGGGVVFTCFCNLVLKHLKGPTCYEPDTEGSNQQTHWKLKIAPIPYYQCGQVEQTVSHILQPGTAHSLTNGDGQRGLRG